MPWLRIGDTAATDPRVLAVDEHPDADDRTRLEVFGFCVLAASMAAQHLQDYGVTYSTAILAAGGSRENADRLLRIAEWAGFGRNTTDPDTGRRLFILASDIDLWHMRSRAELAAENQRRQDTSNPNITVPVRYRDGDCCRYCGTPGNIADRKSARGLTYDHRAPLTDGPATPATVVVACKSCNSSRGAIMTRTPGTYADGLAAADAVHPLGPPPAEPFYHPRTLAWLADPRHQAIREQYGITLPDQPTTAAPVPVAAPAGPAASPAGARPAVAAPGHVEAPAGPAASPAGARSARSDPEPSPTRSNRTTGYPQIPGMHTGTGRVLGPGPGPGPGLAGARSERVGPESTSHRPRRNHRGGRGRKRKGDDRT